MNLIGREKAELNPTNWNFPGGPVVKTLPSNTGGAGPIPGRELRSHMPCGQKTKTEAIL